MDNYRILKWDSDFLGFTVAQILPSTLSRAKLEQVIEILKKEGVKLAYWASDPDDIETQKSAQLCAGFLADRKVTYAIDLQTSQLKTCYEGSVNQYVGNEANFELENLAVQAGIFSRFKVDPKIPEGKFTELYKIWIRNSVNNRIADAVFVSYYGDKVVGMVTVGEKDGRGDIGLIAVDEQMRGKSLGASLVIRAQAWAVDKGFRYAQVVTQGDNVSACRLYEKFGYTVDKIENFYHFWM